MKAPRSNGRFADLVAAMLAAKGWTAYRLAKEAGLPLQTVAGILGGNVPRCDTLEKLLAAAELDGAWFAAHMPPPFGRDAKKPRPAKAKR